MPKLLLRRQKRKLKKKTRKNRRHRIRLHLERRLSRRRTALLSQKEQALKKMPKRF